MKAIIELDIPEYQIGQNVQIYFSDTMKMNGTCVQAPPQLESVKIDIEGGGHTWWCVCSECREVIKVGTKFCPQCGRKIDWGGKRDDN